MKKRISILVVAMFSFGLILSFFTASTVFARNGIRVECKSRIDANPNFRDISMDARYEERDGRRKFSASFEARKDGVFDSVESLRVVVNGVFVGDMMLLAPTGPDIQGDLNFDTTAGPGDADLPFPDDFPLILDSGDPLEDTVMVWVLGCDLE